MLHGSREMIMWTAKSVFDEKNGDPATRDLFVTSQGWFEKFTRRHGLSLSEEKPQLLKKTNPT